MWKLAFAIAVLAGALAPQMPGLLALGYAGVGLLAAGVGLVQLAASPWPEGRHTAEYLAKQKRGVARSVRPAFAG